MTLFFITLIVILSAITLLMVCLYNMNKNYTHEHVCKEQDVMEGNKVKFHNSKNCWELWTHPNFTRINIIYCPFCGEKLEKPKED